MILKGIPSQYKPFVVVVTHSDKEVTFQEFKVMLRSYEETEKAHKTEDDSVFKTVSSTHQGVKCYSCGNYGHISRNCPVGGKASRPNVTPTGTGKWKTSKLWSNNCKKSNHSDRTCRKQKTNVKKANDVPETTEDAYSFAFKLDCDPQQEKLSHTLLVDCGSTSHILNDEAYFVSFDHSFEPKDHIIELADGSRETGVAEKRGEARLKFQDKDGKIADITLSNALCIPSYPQSIFSVRAATECGATKMAVTIILCLIVIISQSHASQEGCPPPDPTDLKTLLMGIPPPTSLQRMNIARDIQSGYIASVSNYILQNGPILEGSSVLLDNGELARPTVTFTQDQLDAVERCYSGRTNSSSRQIRDVAQMSGFGSDAPCIGDVGQVLFAINLRQEVVQPIRSFSAMNCRPSAGRNPCFGSCCEQSFCFNAVVIALTVPAVLDVSDVITVNYCTCCQP
ncbi:hypothetical protein HOLleu_28938 [Holothuria leucospilota]|uniref:CCHC-type domain-containing protein n=1 Tax=Holothuria leucospilota TaxID=206669 RepID=A0A9Q1BN51_HOLLE|nr:hypothetical protein HOLleu_28938 [Holothuria leucospilota]